MPTNGQDEDPIASGHENADRRPVEVRPTRDVVSSARPSWYWPDTSTLEGSKAAANYGAVAALFCALATVVLVVLRMVGVSFLPPGSFDATALIDAVLFLSIAWGIRKMNRGFAVAGILLYVLERAYAWSQGGPKGIAMAIFLFLGFVNGVRGAFGYHRLANEHSASNPPPPPPGEIPD